MLHKQIISLFTDWTRDPRLFDPISATALLIDALMQGLLCNWQPRPEHPAGGAAVDQAASAA